MKSKLKQSHLYHISEKLERVDKNLVSIICLCASQQKEQESTIRVIRAQLSAIKGQIEQQMACDDIDRIPVDDL